MLFAVVMVAGLSPAAAGHPADGQVMRLWWRQRMQAGIRPYGQ
jgi:hypothetical protein